MGKSKYKKYNKKSFFSSLKKSHGSRVGHEIWALVFFLIAFFIFLCNEYPHTTGILGSWIQYLTARLFGIKGSTYLPLFLFIATLSLLYTNIRKNVIIVSSIISYFSFVILLESASNLVSTTPFFRLESQIGGIVGIIGRFILHKLIGYNGTLLFLIGTFSISCILLFGFSINRMLTQFYQVVKFLYHKLISPQSFIQQLNSNKIVRKNDNLNSRFNWKSYLIKLFFYKKVTADPLQTPFDDILPVNNIKKEIQPISDISIQENTASRLLSEDDIFEMPTLKVDNALVPADQHSQNCANLSSDSHNNVSISGKSDIKNDSPQSSSINYNPATEKIPESFKLPSPSLLKSGKKINLDSDSLKKYNDKRARILEGTLHSFNVIAQVINITTGPSVTRFELQPGEGIKISKITNLSKDIALKLAASDIRIEAPIPGKALVGIEVPNDSINMLSFRSLLDQTAFYTNPAALLTLIGMSITGESIVMDLAKLPHILIAGATGSGKSVCINVIILSLLMRSTPNEVKFLMIDPKKVELSLYDGIPHLLAPVVTNPHKAAATLKKWALIEMERRYELFAQISVKDITGYNEYVVQELKKFTQKKKKSSTTPLQESIDNADSIFSTDSLPSDDYQNDHLDPPLQKLPYIVVIIDELADLMMVASQDVEQTICRLAQMARATGIHLVIATQRPSVNVVTGLIKANIPSRISFFLQSQIDSRTILDMPGAEKLLGKGDMLYSPAGSLKPKRVQGVFISEGEVKNVVQWLKSQAVPEYNHDILDVTPLNEDTESDGKNNAHSNANQDVLYEDAKSLIMSTQYASTSYLQRKLRIGYNRAARIMDELTENGIIAEYAGEKKPRNLSV